MAGSVLVFLAIFGGAVFAAALWKRRVAEMIPLSVVFLIVHSALCGKIGLLRFSAVATVLGMIGLGIAGLLLSLRKSTNWRPQWDISLLYFAVGFAWILYIGMGRLPLEAADYTQWALAPKAMFYFNSMTPDGWAASLAPALAVFQTIFQGCNALLAPADGYQDWLLYAAYGTACLALLLPFVRSAHPNKYVRAGYTLLYFVAVLCIPLLFFDLFSALRPDGFLAILAAAAFFSELREKSISQAVFTGLYLFTLTLAGAAGLYFALVALLVYLVTLRRAEVYRLAALGRRVALAVVPAAFVLLAKLCWWGTGVSLHGAEAAGDTLRLFWQSFIAKSVGVRLGLTISKSTIVSLATVHLSFLAITVSLAAFTALLIRGLKRHESLRDTRTALFFAPVAAVLYGIGLFLAYLFAADPADAAKLPYFDQCIAVGAVFWALLLVAIWQQRSENIPRWTWRRHTLVILACLCLIFAGSGAISGLTARGFTADNDKYHTYYAVADSAQRLIPEDARVYIVSQNDDGTAYDTIRYALCPRETNTGTTWWLRDPEAKQYDWTYAVTSEQWKAALADYDYVLTYRTDDYLQTAIAEAITADGTIESNSIFTVNAATEWIIIVE